MANLVKTLDQAKKIQTAFTLGTPIAAPISLVQSGESDLSFLFFVDLKKERALEHFKDLNLKVLGEQTYEFAGANHTHMQFELQVQIEEDWELEEDIFQLWGGYYGYKTPTQILKSGKPVMEYFD